MIVGYFFCADDRTMNDIQKTERDLANQQWKAISIFAG
jgi:hypothetical protein